MFSISPYNIVTNTTTPSTTKEVSIMENKLIKMADSIPALIKNTNLTISLEGWPAAIAAVALFGSCVAIYAIRIAHSVNAEEVPYATDAAA